MVELSVRITIQRPKIPYHKIIPGTSTRLRRCRLPTPDTQSGRCCRCSRVPLPYKYPATAGRGDVCLSPVPDDHAAVSPPPPVMLPAPLNPGQPGPSPQYVSEEELQVPYSANWSSPWRAFGPCTWDTNADHWQEPPDEPVLAPVHGEIPILQLHRHELLRLVFVKRNDTLRRPDRVLVVHHYLCCTSLYSPMVRVSRKRETTMVTTKNRGREGNDRSSHPS